MSDEAYGAVRLQLCRTHGIVRFEVVELDDADRFTKPGDRCSRCHDEMPVVELDFETYRALNPVLRYWETKVAS